MELTKLKLAKIDLNFKGHNLILYKVKFYICTNCSVKLHYNFHISNWILASISINRINKFDLSCDEMIIKNIIE